MFRGVFEKSIIARSIANKLLDIRLINLRDFGLGKRKIVDDKPYGGGKGMVLMAQPIVEALHSIKSKPYIILLSASGKKYTQKTAKFLAGKKSIAIICGHYEGVDARVEGYANTIISIGDFILTGGEIPSMAVVDSVTRLIPGAINKKSLESESFSLGSPKRKFWGDLEYPQYTRPPIYNRKKVPTVLLSGNHKQISKWREKQSLKKTIKFRPDLLKNS